MIGQAILDRVAAAQWLSVASGNLQGFEEHSRKLKMFDAAMSKPAVFLTDHGESVIATSRVGTRSTRQMSLIVYHDAARINSDCIPADEDEAIIKAVRETLRPRYDDFGYPETNTLGNLCERCRIEGQIVKVPGDIDGEAMIVIPITVLEYDIP